MTRLSSWACLLLTCVACNEEKSREPLPDWQEGYESGSDPTSETDTDTVIQIGKAKDAPEEAFALGMPETITYPYRLRELGTGDAPCAAGGDFVSEVTCVLDINELDLNLLGFGHNIIAPISMCDFVLIHPYIFENWETRPRPHRGIVGGRRERRRR